MISLNQEERFVRFKNEMNEVVTVCIEPYAEERRLESNDVVYIKTDIFSTRYDNERNSKPELGTLEISTSRLENGELYITIWIMTEVAQFAIPPWETGEV
jgi:hypothetical protein